MGDFGYVGAPVLGATRKRGGLVPFGVIYEGFAALRMVTSELAAFKVFLDAHDGHPITQSSDFGEEDFDGGEDGEEEGPGRLKAFRFKSGRLAEGFYELSCPQCSEVFRASSSGKFLPFDEFSPTREDLERFNTGVLRTDDENFYKVGGFPFDDLGALSHFLATHRGHDLRGRLDRAKPAPAPPAMAKKPTVESWVPPTWAPEEHEEYLGRVRLDVLPRLAALHHWDAARRAAACAEVAATGEHGVLGYLVALLQDPEIPVRVAAVRAIAVLGDPRGVRALGRALLEEAEAVRDAARQAVPILGASEAEAVRQARTVRGPYMPAPRREFKPAATPEGVEAALRDPRVSFRYAAAELLGKKHRESWAQDLFHLLAVDPLGYLRDDAAEGLATRKDPRADPALLALLSDYHPSPAEKAAKAVGARRLRKAVEPLVQALCRGGVSLASAAGEALEKIGDPGAAMPLTHALGHPMPEVRAAAAKALGALRDDTRVAALASLLSDVKASVREAAARALGSIGGAGAAVALVGHLRSESADDRRFAVWGLSSVRHDKAVAGLVACLRDRDKYVRWDAAGALAPLNSPRGERALLAAARRGDAGVAVQAWRVLIAIGDPATEEALAVAVSYDSPGEMVRAYLDCGNARLARTARKVWGTRRLAKRGPVVRWGERGTHG